MTHLRVFLSWWHPFWLILEKVDVLNTLVTKWQQPAFSQTPTEKCCAICLWWRNSKLYGAATGWWLQITQPSLQHGQHSSVTCSQQRGEKSSSLNGKTIILDTQCRCTHADYSTNQNVLELVRRIKWLAQRAKCSCCMWNKPAQLISRRGITVCSLWRQPQVRTACLSALYINLQVMRGEKEIKTRCFWSADLGERRVCHEHLRTHMTLISSQHLILGGFITDI